MSRATPTPQTNVNVQRRRAPRAVRAPQVPAPELAHPSCLSDADLLSWVLEVTGPTPKTGPRIGQSVLSASAGIGGLSAFVNLRLHRAEETQAPSLSVEQLHFLAAALELGRRASVEPLSGLKITSHRDVQRWARGRLVGLEYEEVWVLALRANQRVCAEWCVARGGVHGCGLLPADVLRPVLRCAASAFILVHNHPSGDPTPSRDDVAMTSALHQACMAVGVTLMDHVIVSRGGSYSLAEACLFDGFVRRNAAE